MNAASQILADLTSLHWWVSVFLVGVLTSVVGAYAKPRLDNWLATFSVRRRSANERERAEFEAYVEKLIADPQLLALECFEEARARIRFLFHFVAMFALTGVGIFVVREVHAAPMVLYILVPIIAGAALLAMTMVQLLLQRAADKARVIEEVHKRLKERSAA